MAENLNLKTVDTVDTRPFKKLIMTIGELPTSFIESMTYYELLAWFVNYLETVIIPTVNNNGEAVEELQGKFIELNTAFNTLKNYVDTYFDNLDVQDEINNKLDDMAEAGTLQEIITTYIQSNVAWAFDTVADMKAATNLVDESFAQTLGYYSVNDGGASLYKIRTKTNNDSPDEMVLIAIGTNLVAELIYANVITSKQCGLKGDGTTDETAKLNAFFSLTTPVSKIVNRGTYLISSTLFIKGVWSDSLPYRQRVKFDEASIKYTGTAGNCSVAIFNFQRGDIDGLNIAHSSNDNYILVLGCWFTNINGAECRSLKLSTDGTIVSSLAYDNSSCMNVNFNNLRLWRGTLILDSQSNSYINSIFFNETTINSTDKNYCVEVTSDNGTENITFTNCDLSYATSSVFKLKNTAPTRSTININNCYMDSNVPLFYNNNTENFLITGIGNYIGSGYKHLPITFRDISNVISLGSHTNNANFIGCENVNYAINGDFSSSNTLNNNSSIMGRSGTYSTREYITTSLNVNNRGRRITYSREGTHTFYENITITDLPREGAYTAYARMKIISGNFSTLRLRFNTYYYELLRSEIPDGKEILITYSPHDSIAAGAHPSCYFEFLEVEGDVVAEYYEVGVIYGNTLIPYPKLHELAKI